MEYILKFILFLFVNNITHSYSQSFLNYIPEYMDIDITSNMIDSLKKEGVNTFFLYLTTIYENKIDENITNNDSLNITYFIWVQENRAYVILISDSCIYNSLCLTSDTLFRYPYLNKTWLQEDEDIYKLVPPFNAPYNKDIVIYITPISKTFFEIGVNAYYKLNASRNKYRYEFISLIKNTLLSTNKRWEKACDYDRWKDFFGE